MTPYPFPELGTSAFDFESIAVSNAVIGLTATKFNPVSAVPANTVMFTVETNDIRYRFDGGDPSATVGHKVVAGAAPVLVTGEQNIANLKFIRVSADATVFVTYER